ncbi:response regulator [Paenibacillus sp. TRM 82003]|nr:response regulator [Paenibacillus sp. TRM 82003]
MKVLIVDDEIIIRTGLSTLVEWEAHGFEVMRPAASAEEALLRIPDERPELILTDIRMTGRSGLELASDVKKAYPDTEIVVISGFDEFAYARQALREGVSDYLLKTSEPEEILQVALRAKERCQRRRNAVSEERVREETARRGALERIASDDRPLDKAAAAAFEAHFPALRAALEAHGVEALRVSFAAAGAEAEALEAWARSFAARRAGAEWLAREGGLLLLAPAAPDDGWDRAEQAVVRTNEGIGRASFAAAGVPAKTPDGIRLAIATANEAFAYGWLLPEAGFLRYASIRGRAGMRTICTAAEEAALCAALKSGDERTLRGWVRKTLADIRQDVAATPTTAQAYLHSLLLAGCRWVERAAASVGDERPMPPWEPLVAERLLADAEAETFRLFAALSRRYAEAAAGRSPVSLALAYVGDHLHESLTLQQVAGQVHLNPNYFSELFKRETGRTFADYVREAKLRKAMALLADTPAKVAEVAHRVGYADLKHFNRLFKQFTGRTPTEYRGGS